MTKIQRFSSTKQGMRFYGRGEYVLHSDYENQLKAAESLIDGFVNVYGEFHLTRNTIAPGMKLWRDYYEWTGDHMILTDEGWEPGEQKQSYIDQAASEGCDLGDFIQDEVNAPVR
jgi:hypothetical protein